MNTNSNMWILNFGKSLIENDFKWNFINPEINIIPTNIKEILENLFGCKLEFIVRFPYSGHKSCEVHSYSISIFSNNKLIAKVNSCQLKIVDNNTSIIQLIENNKKHALHFNFRDIKQIYVPRTIYDGVKWNEDIIRINISTTIKNNAIKNECKVNTAVMCKTNICNDLIKEIMTYNYSNMNNLINGILSNRHVFKTIEEEENEKTSNVISSTHTNTVHGHGFLKSIKNLIVL